MIIRTAAFLNLHGHLNPKLSFRPGVNILIGVNGSGKTSVLNAMAWTLSPASVQGGLPAAYLLSTLRFDEIKIAYSIPGQRKYQRVRARRSEEAVTIEISGLAEALEIPVIRPRISPLNEDLTVDDSVEVVARSMSDQRNNPVLRHLNELSGPLYLPLDRRWTEDREIPYGRLARRRPHARRSTTAGHLPVSEVVVLAERALAREQNDTYRLNHTLRDTFLESLFEVDEFAEVSRVWTMEEFADRRSRIVTALSSLGVKNIQAVTGQFFASVEKVVTELGGCMQPENWQEDPKASVWVDWILKASPVVLRIERLISLIEQYDSDISRITRPSRMFLHSVNSFLANNGKKLDFNQRSELTVTLSNGQVIGTHHLASGELQLLILFTFLYFQFDNPNQEFTVMVDEPELSLHVAWQNRYVDSIKEANPNAQFIIATHSPEIAGQVEDKIIDISP